MQYVNQVAVITGAASGIGKAIALKLASAGVRLLLLDLYPDGTAETTACFSEAEIIPADMTDENQIRAIFTNIGQKYGRIDMLVNSAGITGITGINSHEVNTADLAAVFNVNFFGSFLTSKYALPLMLERNYGRILHIASIAGKEGNAGMLAYSASKAAVIGMTKVQGKEYAETGITVNCIAPAVIRTALVDRMPEQQVKYMTDKIPMKRCGTLGEIADLAWYILSPSTAFTTGFAFDLSGGRATY